MQPAIINRFKTARSVVQANNMAIDQGGRYIGSGQATKAYGFRVYLQPSIEWDVPTGNTGVPVKSYAAEEAERVLRVSKNEAASAAVVRLAYEMTQSNEPDPYYPRVYGLYELEDGLVSEMEKLSSANSYSGGDAFLPDPKLWDMKGGRPVPNRLMGEHSPFIKELIAMQAKHGWMWDLHSGNFMWRPASRATGRHIVVLDPLYLDD